MNERYELSKVINGANIPGWILGLFIVALAGLYVAVYLLGDVVWDTRTIVQEILLQTQ